MRTNWQHPSGQSPLPKSYDGVIGKTHGCGTSFLVFVVNKTNPDLESAVIVHRNWWAPWDYMSPGEGGGLESGQPSRNGEKCRNIAFKREQPQANHVNAIPERKGYVGNTRYLA